MKYIYFMGCGIDYSRSPERTHVVELHNIVKLYNL